MSVHFDGKINLLSGHYQDIIMSENKKDNFRIKIIPNEPYHVETLDSSYCYSNYNGLSDLEKAEKVIDSYLYHNTVFMLSNHGKLKNHTGNYLGINAYTSILGDYQDYSRAMYLKLQNSNLLQKIAKKYYEDRIRHLDEILNCKTIIVNLSHNLSSYTFDNDTAYVTLLSEFKEFEEHILPTDFEFLMLLLREFSKNNCFKFRESYEHNQIEIYTDSYQYIEIPYNLLSYVYQVNIEIYQRLKEQEKNITIEEYLTLQKKKNSN